MIIEGVTVTLPLNEFDGLRTNSEELRRLTKRIAACFEYKIKDNGDPRNASLVKKENPDCTKCKVFNESPPWEETLTVDVERLIKVAKQYALYGKDIEADVEEATVVIKELGADK